MTILFAGGEIGAFTPSSASATELVTSALYNSSFSRCALTANGSATFNDSSEFTETAEVWLHFDLGQNGNNSPNTTQAALVKALDGSGTEVFQLASDYSLQGVRTFQLKYNNAGTWTNLGSSFTANAALETIDIHLVANTASGSGTVYFSGTQRSTGTADLSGISGVAQIRQCGISPAGPALTHISQVIVADESTIGWRLKTVPPTGAGASTSWTGGYTEVDETIYDDGDFINSAIADQVELFTHSTTIPTGYAVRAAVVTARAKCGATGPQNLRLVLRSSSTNYDNGADLALDAGYGAFVAIWETDPATSADFTTSAISSLQFGVKSIT